MKHSPRTALALMLIIGNASWPVTAAAGNDPADAVTAFNESISARDQDTALAQLAPGGVQFTLRAMHEGTSPDKLVTPITPHWSMIIPVLFASTSSYARDVEVLSSEAHGDVATVWTRTRTESVRAGSDDAAVNEFTETYLLVNSPDGWKIAAIADNRRATSIAAE